MVTIVFEKKLNLSWCVVMTTFDYLLYGQKNGKRLGPCVNQVHRSKVLHGYTLETDINLYNSAESKFSLCNTSLFN